jgi:hypothetical protein
MKINSLIILFISLPLLISNLSCGHPSVSEEKERTFINNYIVEKRELLNELISEIESISQNDFQLQKHVNLNKIWIWKSDSVLSEYCTGNEDLYSKFEQLNIYMITKDDNCNITLDLDKTINGAFYNNGLLIQYDHCLLEKKFSPNGFRIFNQRTN